MQLKLFTVHCNADDPLVIAWSGKTVSGTPLMDRILADPVWGPVMKVVRTAVKEAS